MSAMLEYMDSHENCVACQPKILSQSTPLFFEYAGAAGGFIDRYGYPYCRGRVLSDVEKDLGQYDSVMEIFWATGACLMIRREAYWSDGGLDGRFFAHQEEIDLCWRLKARGGSIVCIPQSVVYHVGAGTLSYESPFKTFLNFRNNALLIYKNADPARYPWIRFVRLTLDFVAALHLLAQRRPKNAWNVCRAQFAFWRMKNEFKEDRKENIAKTINKFPDGVLNHLLLFDVYFKRKRTFSAIHQDIRYKKT
jgi:GT2 family glycosyltransferase